MLPITGPFTVVKGSLSSDFFHRVTSRRQARPYNLPLPMSSEKLDLVSKRFSGDTCAMLSGILPRENELRDQAYAKAYKNLVSQLGQASLGAATATMGQSVSMIASRLTQMTRFVKALKRGRLGEAAEALGSPTPLPRSRYKTPKNLSGQILEYNYGWAPLVADIQGGLEILQGDIPSLSLIGKGSSEVAFLLDKPRPYDPPRVYMDTGSSISYVCRVTCGTSVRMTNPNLALATALGLTDPLEVLFEITPWSFVLDWVSNLSQFLTSWNDFLGYAQENSFSTELHVSVHDLTTNQPHVYPLGRGSSVRMARTLGLPKPPLAFKPLRFGVQRAANACSLLIQQLPRR